MTDKSSELTTLTSLQLAVLKLLGDGIPAPTIARRLAKGDAKVARNWRQRIRNWSYSDQAFIAALHMQAQGTFNEALPAISAAVVKRAKRGRTDAARIVFEATGFHNPRVKHEHSGDISITVKSIPRAVEPDADIPDADVVEE